MGNVEEDDRMWQKCYDASRGNLEVFKYFDIPQRVAQGHTLPPTLPKVIVYDLIIAIGAAKPPVKMRRGKI